MKVYFVVLNWNGKDFVQECLDSLANQSYTAEVIVVDNGSSDGSAELIEKNYPEVHLIKESKNHGFAGGVNIGLRHALDNKAEAIALFNNDAVAEKDWLEKLVNTLAKDKKVGAVTGKLLSGDGKKIDNTGDEYSIWGLSIPRQRDLSAADALDEPGEVFGACAGAALYRAAAIKDAGLFDEKFFAYYEDTDYNFRLRLRGWKIIYQPTAVAYHHKGRTSDKVHGFTTLQTMKNPPMLFWKNVPAGLIPKMLPRFLLAHISVFFSSVLKGRGLAAIKGTLLGFKNIPHTLLERRHIQKNRQVDTEYIRSILYNDLPPGAARLRRLRSFFSLSRHPRPDA